MTAPTATLDEVRRVAGHYASGREATIQGVAEAIGESNIEAGKDYLRGQGLGAYTYLLDGINLPAVEDQGEGEAEGFDREHAVEVITAYAQSLGHGADLTPMLIEAGLVDAPEPEVEAETEQVDAGLFRRLVDFARGHGFRG